MSELLDTTVSSAEHPVVSIGQLADSLPSYGGKEKLMAAVCKCMLAIGKIGKEGRNAHANYNFASIDDFLAITSQACGANGIVVLQQEVSCSTVTVNNRAWVMMEFDFIVCHSSGQTLPAVRRSVGVMWSGSQSYGSAQSYALKQFLRSLFQIACGDQDDPDFQEHASANKASQTPIKAQKTPAAKRKQAKPAAKKADPKPVISPETIEGVESMLVGLDWFFFDKTAFWSWMSNFFNKPTKQITQPDLEEVVRLLKDFAVETKWHAKWSGVHKAMVGVARPGQESADKAIEEVFGSAKRTVSEDDISMIEGLIEMSDSSREDVEAIIKQRYDCKLSDLAFAQGCELLKNKF